MRNLLIVCFLCLSVSIFGAGAERSKICDDLTDGDCAGVTSENSLKTRTTSYVHEENHKGNVFSASWVLTNGANQNPQYIHINTSSAPETHLRIAIGTDTAGEFELYEDAVVGSVGTSITGYCKNRTSSNTTVVQTWYSPNTTTAGTIIEYKRIGVGGNQNVGGTSESTNEWILDDASNYVIKFTPDGNSAIVEYDLEWYVK